MVYTSTEKAPLLRSRSSSIHRRLPRLYLLLAFVLSTTLLILQLFQTLTSISPLPRGDLKDFTKAQKCSIDNLKADRSFLDNAVPIRAEEFLERRDKLAQALVENDADAFVLEPGYTFQ